MRGFRLAIDDFGTGYSSMDRLSRLPFTELKIDQAFVRRSAMDAAGRVIVESSLELAKRLGLDVVAEGVESQLEWDVLLGMGCPAAQGFHVAPAMPAGEFSAWLERCRLMGADACGE